MAAIVDWYRDLLDNRGGKLLNRNIVFQLHRYLQKLYYHRHSPVLVAIVGKHESITVINPWFIIVRNFLCVRWLYCIVVNYWFINLNFKNDDRTGSVYVVVGLSGGVAQRRWLVRRVATVAGLLNAPLGYIRISQNVLLWVPQCPPAFSGGARLLACRLSGLSQHKWQVPLCDASCITYFNTVHTCFMYLTTYLFSTGLVFTLEDSKKQLLPKY